MNINNILRCVTYRVILYSVPNTSATAIFLCAVRFQGLPHFPFYIYFEMTPSDTEIAATISAPSWF